MRDQKTKMFFASSFFNSSNVWFGYIANAFFTAGALVAIGKLIQKYLTKHSNTKIDKIERDVKASRQDMDKKFELLLSQHRNNGGSSAKDQWDRLEEKVDYLADIDSKIDRLSDIMNRHLGYHEGIKDAGDE